MSVIHAAKIRVMEKSRAKKLARFYSLCPEGSKVLDVGVSAVQDYDPPSQNFFLKSYRYDPSTYTGLGVEDQARLKTLYPDFKFVQYPGDYFPFEDKQFDWVFSNAVIEHVGDDDAKLLFINEMLRVGKRVYFTTPNKFFPVESHTNVLFRHWHDDHFYKWCEKHKPWARRENLHLLSYARLKGLLDASNASVCQIYKNRFFGLPMTFTVECHQGA